MSRSWHPKGRPGTPRVGPLRGRHRRRASVLAFAVVLLVVLIAVTSLAVDYGRVELAKTEMQRAVDAATRAAVAHLPDAAAARAAAVEVAAANPVAEHGLSLLPADVEVGRWDPATGTLDTSSASPNAVRVTGRRTAARGNAIPRTFAEIFGVRPQDLTVSQTSTGSRAPVGGIVGYDAIVGKNNFAIASYNSARDTDPKVQTANRNGAVGSNGTIDGKNNNVIYGDVYRGPASTLTGTTVSGKSAPQAADLVRPTSPAWNPGTNPAGTPRAYAASGNVTLPAGTYWFTSLSVDGTLSFAGPSTVYLNGDASVDGTLRAADRLPASLKVYVIGARTFGDAGANDFDVTADIEAPQAAFVAKNNFTFRGRMFFDSIEFKNNADLYYDESFGRADGSATVQTVVN
jgi:Flp pilus assembly protein TadG